MIDNNKVFFKELINEGGKVLKRSHWDGRQYKNSSSAPSSEEYSSLIYRGMDIILKVFNKDSSYYRGLESIVSDENKFVLILIIMHIVLELLKVLIKHI